MKRRITIVKAENMGHQLFLQASAYIDQLVPGVQILVDSEQYSFVYLMEDQDDYTYIVLPEEIWPLIKSAYDQKIPVWLTYNGQQIEMTDFHEELVLCIDNIKGNSNYGKEMVAKVEGIF